MTRQCIDWGHPFTGVPGHGEHILQARWISQKRGSPCPGRRTLRRWCFAWSLQHWLSGNAPTSALFAANSTPAGQPAASEFTATRLKAGRDGPIALEDPACQTRLPTALKKPSFQCADSIQASRLLRMDSSLYLSNVGQHGQIPLRAPVDRVRRLDGLPECSITDRRVPWSVGTKREDGGSFYTELSA